MIMNGASEASQVPIPFSHHFLGGVADARADFYIYKFIILVFFLFDAHRYDFYFL